MYSSIIFTGDHMFYWICIGMVLLVTMYAAYLTLVYLYKAKDPRKWKPLLTSKEDTLRSIFGMKENALKNQEKNNQRQNIK
jgi:hypothetical protein